MKINDELIAAYLEGNVNEDERRAVRNYLAAHPEMTDLMLSLIDDSDFDIAEESEPVKPTMSKVTNFTESPSTANAATAIGQMIQSGICNMIGSICGAAATPFIGMTSFHTIDNTPKSGNIEVQAPASAINRLDEAEQSKIRLKQMHKLWDELQK